MRRVETADLTGITLPWPGDDGPWAHSWHCL